MHERPSEDLSTLDPTGRFSNRAEDYRRYRPDYPDAAIGALIEGLGDPGSLRAIDIGAGTGISSRQLADRGVEVVAVEPNAEMRAAATPHLHVRWHDGAAEALGLPDGFAHLVLAAQAFHWFRAMDALDEAHRVLVPRGRLALMWNKRDREDPLTRGYIEAIRAVNGEDPVEQHEFDPAIIDRHGGFAMAPPFVAPHEQPLDLEGFIGRATSASYVPRSGPGHEQLREMLAELFARHAVADRVRMRYRTVVYRATRV